MTYKGFYLYYNKLQACWLVLEAYALVAEYKTLAGAKCAITTKWSKQQEKNI